MFKLLEFDGYDQHGPHIFPVDLGGGNRHIKLATEMHPEIARYISGAKKIPGKTQLLIDALGAGEWWGSNKNGDIFFRDQLEHKGKDYGHETFMHYAYPFKHHCFPAGTQVLMANRERVPIELIKEGDFVETRCGPKRVKGVMSRMYSGNGVRLTLKGRAGDLVSTADHPVFVFRREQIHCRHRYSKLSVSDNPRAHAKECVEIRDGIGDPEYVPVSSVLPGDYLASPVREAGSISVPREFAQLVGWVASEGHIGKRGSIQFTFSENNTEDIEAVKICLEENGLHVGVRNRPQYGVTALSSCSSTVCSDLSEYISGVLSEKTLLSPILNWDKESLLYMLGAYIDGDGYVASKGKNKGALRIRSSSPQMLAILQDIVLILGGNPAVNSDCPPGEIISPTNGKVYKTSGSGCLSIGKTVAADFCKYSRKINPVETKKVRYEKQVGNLRLVRVSDVEEIDLDEEVYNLEIEDVHEYVAGEVLVHNCNKDPAKAYGDKVILSVYNPSIHRVQLIVAVHDDKCRDIISQIDSGTYPETSMGCKVPYDSCSYCGNRAKNRSQYCDHLKYQMNRILPDGRKVMAINHRPKFFDISFVLIGAEKASKVLMKVASQNRVVTSAELGEKHYGPKFWKGADFKNAAVNKKGTITKEVPMKVDSIKPVVESAPDIKSREPELPPAAMKLLEGLPLSEIFSTLAFLGIDPKPEEFQKIVLIKSGQKKLAEDLASRGAVFDEHGSDSVDNPEQYFSIDPDHINEKLAYALRTTIPHRSCFNDFLVARLGKYASENPWYPDENKSSYLPVVPLTAGLAGLYAYMKNKSAEASMTKFEKAILRHPWLFGLLTAAGAGVLAGGINLLKPQPLGSLDTEYGTGYNPHYKTAASKKWLLPLALGPLAYMYSGVQRSRAMRGERLGKFDRFIAQRPDIAAIASMIGAPVAASKGARFARHLKMGSVYKDFGLFSLTSGSKLLPASLLGAMVDAAVVKNIGKIIDKRSKHGNPEGPAR